MIFEVNLIIQEEPKYFLFINHFKAIKNEIVVKEKEEKDFILKENLESKIKDVFNLFNNSKYKLLLNTNSNSHKELIRNIFNCEVSIISEDLYLDSLIEIKNSIEEENLVEHLPSYIYKVENKEFEKNILLFLIASYFDEHQSKVFDFPLFLEMKKNKEIEADMEVEEFLEDLLFRFTKLGE